jgi:ribosomal-protein-alanine N-acetyltransferase
MATTYRLQPMTGDDITEVARVERRCFSNPWPPSAYRRELRRLEQNFYIVLLATPERASDSDGRSARSPLARLVQMATRATEQAGPQVVGFAGMWVIHDEAHVTTIGVDPLYRGRGLGELLLTAMFDEAIRRGANLLTLEVRISNDGAQALYRKYGLSIEGVRRRYYTDNNEDAYIMWSQSLRDPGYLATIAGLKAAVVARLGERLEAAGVGPTGATRHRAENVS